LFIVYILKLIENHFNLTNRFSSEVKNKSAIFGNKNPYFKKKPNPPILLPLPCNLIS